MHRFGLHVMGDVAAMALEKMVGQFGLTGKTAWALCQGVDDNPLTPMKHEESVVERASLPWVSNSLELLLAAVDTLLKRAYARPEMRGRYAGRADLRVRSPRCVLLGRGRSASSKAWEARTGPPSSSGIAWRPTDHKRHWRKSC